MYFTQRFLDFAEEARLVEEGRRGEEGKGGRGGATDPGGGMRELKIVLATFPRIVIVRPSSITAPTYKNSNAELPFFSLSLFFFFNDQFINLIFRCRELHAKILLVRLSHRHDCSYVTSQIVSKFL